MAACAGPAVRPQPPAGADSVRIGGEDGAAQAIPLADSLTETAAYLEQADNTTGPERERNLLLGTAGLFNNGQVHQAQQTYARIDPTLLDANLSARYSLLGAGIALAIGDPHTALARSVAVLNNQGEPDAIRAEALQLAAQSESALGDYGAALDHFLQAEPLLGDSRQLEQNRHQIAQMLQSLSKEQLAQAEQNSRETAAAGWIDLIRIHREYGASPGQLNAQLGEWQNRYPDLTARDYIETSRSGGMARRVALLLPLSSRFGNAAAAVKQGFMDMRAADPAAEAPEIKVYDTGSDDTLLTAFYDTAINDGADLVIGPLGRQATSQMAEHASFNAPTLMLGLVEDYHMPQGVFQLALSPEQEASQAAQRAWLDGRRSTVVLYPRGNWGERVSAAFKQHWEQLGGIVLGAAAYPPRQSDFSPTIKQALDLDSSIRRKNSLQAVLGTRLEFEPRRRKDIDFIMLLATPDQGRLIKPQLEFYDAQRLPVYAISSIYSGNPNRIRDTDLDAIMFGDMPWVLPGDAQAAELKRQIQASGNLPLSGNRLYALGVDAYRLIPYLSTATAGVPIQLNGASGRLQLGANGVFQRWLTWARFQNGVPRLLDVTPGTRSGNEMDDEKSGASLGQGAAPDPGTKSGEASQ